MTKVLIIGAGHAGGTAAALLRQYGHEGPITLIGEEPAALDAWFSATKTAPARSTARIRTAIAARTPAASPPARAAKRK